MRGERFTMPRAEMERRLGSGERYVDIAGDFGVDRWTVRRRAEGFGLSAGRRPRAPKGVLPNRDGLSLVLSHPTISLAEIAKAFGVHVETLRATARSHGLPTDLAGRTALGARR